MKPETAHKYFNAYTCPWWILAAILVVAIAGFADAAPFHRKPVAKPATPAVAPAVVEPAVGPLPEPAPFTVNPDGSVTLSKQHDAELKDWIIGIQAENAKNAQRADDAKASEEKVMGALGQANTRADTLQFEVKTVTDDRNAQAAAKDAALTARDEAIAEKEKERVARVAAEHHVSRIKTWLAVALAAVLVLLVQKLPFGLLMPPASLYARVAASVAAAGLAWLIVARFI